MAHRKIKSPLPLMGGGGGGEEAPSETERGALYIDIFTKHSNEQQNVSYPGKLNNRSTRRKNI